MKLNNRSQKHNTLFCKFEYSSDKAHQRCFSLCIKYLGIILEPRFYHFLEKFSIFVDGKSWSLQVFFFLLNLHELEIKYSSGKRKMSVFTLHARQARLFLIFSSQSTLVSFQHSKLPLVPSLMIEFERKIPLLTNSGIRELTPQRKSKCKKVTWGKRGQN